MVLNTLLVKPPPPPKGGHLGSPSIHNYSVQFITEHKKKSQSRTRVTRATSVQGCEEAHLFPVPSGSREIEAWNRE